MIKKFTKLFVLFTMMNLLGTVVWAGENSATCEASSDHVSAKVLTQDAVTSSQADGSSASSVK
jgi:hypothetical protein